MHTHYLADLVRSDRFTGSKRYAELRDPAFSLACPQLSFFTARLMPNPGFCSLHGTFL
jgi:hypothetical protein